MSAIRSDRLIYLSAGISTEDNVLSTNLLSSPTYADLRANKTLCQTYVEEMAQVGEKVKVMEDKPATASTDMGECSLSYNETIIHGYSHKTRSIY